MPIPHYRSETPSMPTTARPIKTTQGHTISKPTFFPESTSPGPRHPPLIHRTNTTASTTSQGSKVVDYSEISGPFREAEVFRKGLRQQGNRNQTPDCLRNGGGSKRKSGALASSPPVSPMNGSRFHERFDKHDAVEWSPAAEKLERLDTDDRPGGSHQARFSDVSLSDEFPTSHNAHIRSPRVAAPLRPPPPPPPHAEPAQQDPYFCIPPSSREGCRPRTSLVHRIMSHMGKSKRRTAKYIMLFLLLLVVAFLIYVFFHKVLPVYSKLQDLKNKLATLDAFKDKVVAKLGVWLDDGKELVGNVKDMVGDGVDRLVDAANKMLGKVRVNIPHVDLEQRRRARSARAVMGEHTGNTSTALSTHIEFAEAMAARFALESRQSSRSASNTVNFKSVHGCDMGRHFTSTARPRAYIPLPFSLLANLAKRVRSVSSVDEGGGTGAEGCDTSTVKVTTTMWLPVTPTNEVINAVFA
ncbi:hypothetical protein PMIN06_009992 [Paraphaeosphaeria minitans]